MFETRRPLFRTDLQCKALDAGGETFVDVVDPGSGTSFRLYELEFAIACAMDGTRDVADLASWASAELGLAPDRAELETVIGQLDRLGYLTELGADAAAVELGSYTATATATAPARGGFVADDTAARAARADLELGAPGKSPVFDRPEATLPETGDVELGHPGIVASATAGRSPTPVRGVELGAAGRSELGDDGDERVAAEFDDMPTGSTARPVAADARDVSTDLSQQFELKADDVKEAVRQSRAMPQVSAPADHEDDSMTINSMMSTVDTGPVDAAATEVSIPGADKSKATVLPVTPARGGTSATSPHDKVTEKGARGEADETTAETRRPAAATEPPPRQGVAARNILIAAALLLLAALGGTFAYLKYTDDVGRPPPPRAPRPETPSTGAAAPSPVAPPATAVALTAGEAEPIVVAAAQAGVVEWVADPGAKVAAGDPVVKFAGVAGVEAEVQRSKDRLKVYQDQYDVAAAKDDKEAMKTAEADVKRKQRDLERATAKLAGLVVAAPSGGTVEPSVAAKARIALGAELATLTPNPPLRAVLPAGGAPRAVGQDVTLAARGDASRTAICKVVEVAADGAATVECPGDGALAAGNDVLVATP